MELHKSIESFTFKLLHLVEFNFRYAIRKKGTLGKSIHH